MKAQFGVEETAAEKSQQRSRHAAYAGPERRKQDRRECSERREQIRFEPNPRDRRQRCGRRSEDSGIQFY